MCFLESKFQNINLGEPFHFIYEIYRRENTPGYRLLSGCLEISLDKTKGQVRGKSQNATKFILHIDLS